MRISATNGSAMAASQVGDGKIPNSEMMKLMQRYGWKLSCGWLPPVLPANCGDMATEGAALVNALTCPDLAMTLALGVGELAISPEPRRAWVCAGIWFVVSVTD